MATSSPDDAPRDLEFLYSGNRLNVAVSRARGLAVVLANPELLRVACHTPEQMRLVNAFCRLVEVAAEQQDAGPAARLPPGRHLVPVEPLAGDRGIYAIISSSRSPELAGATRFEPFFELNF